MFDQYSAAAISSFLPDLTYNLPLVGVVNFNLLLTSAIVFVVLNAFFWLVRRVVISRLKILSKKTTSNVDDVVVGAVEGIRVWVYSIVSVYAALLIFPLPVGVDRTLTAVFLFAIVWQLIEIALCFVEYFAGRFLASDADTTDSAVEDASTAANMITLFAKAILWGLGGLFILSNLGIEVVSLIAGLGVGGIAVAFALQGILADLFASLSIYLDKPFKVGDLITIGTDTGTVEKIGVKTTRIRTLRGEQLIVSNTELTTARVQNLKKMEERRVVTGFGVIYETPQDKLAQINGIVATIFNHIPGVRLDRVHFLTMGDFSLNFEVVYHVESSSFEDYANVQQTFNFEIMKQFEAVGIEFAYPTQVQYNKTV